MLERDWSPGDTVVLHLDVSERIVRARAEVADVAGLVARMRGPLLMARENGRLIPYYDVANNGPAPHEVWSDADQFVGLVCPMVLRDPVAIVETDE